jgi:hypothetical protein
MDKGDPVAIDFENGVVTHEGNECHFPALSVGSLATLEDRGDDPSYLKLLSAGKRKMLESTATAQCLLPAGS